MVTLVTRTCDDSDDGDDGVSCGQSALMVLIVHSGQECQLLCGAKSVSSYDWPRVSAPITGQEYQHVIGQKCHLL
ncbi:hypothetical protein Hamer_G009791 [Homarus americanus]|uniref:Uncharacterized protein n=1 Tax=Homarus americanus TaxID=6706 RepID=A0A8J5NAA1_HOMAM|nr:hypothetical protein Hamer_G009791 [Homarus americanus]